MLIFIATILAGCAAVSGILAVGSGRHWQFTVSDYFRGKRNAILYLWVIASTIFTICLCGMCGQYGITFNWTPHSEWAPCWFVVHSITSILLISAHIYVAKTLAREVGPVDKYLWGKRRNVR